MKKYIIIIAFFVSGCIATRPTTRIDFDAPDTYPEGIAYDAANDVFYVSSQRLGTIGKVTRQGQYSVLYTDNTLKSSYGMKVHPDGKRLFAVVSDPLYSRLSTPETRRKMSRLISIDIASGKKLSDIDLSGLVPGKHFANDLVFDDKGNIFITDSYAAAIYKVTPDGTASLFAKDKQFETEGIGLNGIVYHPNGYLLVDNTNKGRIYKVEINNPQNVQRVLIDMYFLGMDGMVLKDNKLTFAVNGGNEKIYQIESKDDWKTADLNASTLVADRFTYPATAAIAGDDIWIMNAKTHDLNDSNAFPAKKFAIQLVKLKPLPKTKNKEFKKS